MCHGTYSSDDCVGDIAGIKFDRPVTAEPHTKYALRLNNHGARTNNGDGGQSAKRGSDGPTFTFTYCSLSFNRTTVTPGHYYTTLSEEPPITDSTVNLAETCYLIYLIATDESRFRCNSKVIINTDLKVAKLRDEVQKQCQEGCKKKIF